MKVPLAGKVLERYCICAFPTELAAARSDGRILSVAGLSRTEAGSKGQTSAACDNGVYSLH